MTIDLDAGTRKDWSVPVHYSGVMAHNRAATLMLWW